MRLPAPLRGRFVEELDAEPEDIQGPVSKLMNAFGAYKAAGKIKTLWRAKAIYNYEVDHLYDVLEKVSESAARSHIKSIFLKTGRKDQPQLVGLLVRIVLSVSTETCWGKYYDYSSIT